MATCPSCHATIVEQARRCGNCGRSLLETVAIPRSSPKAAPAPVAPASTPTRGALSRNTTQAIIHGLVGMIYGVFAAAVVFVAMLRMRLLAHHLSLCVSLMALAVVVGFVYGFLNSVEEERPQKQWPDTPPADGPGARPAAGRGEPSADQVRRHLAVGIAKAGGLRLDPSALTDDLRLSVDCGLDEVGLAEALMDVEDAIGRRDLFGDGLLLTPVGELIARCVPGYVPRGARPDQPATPAGMIDLWCTGCARDHSVPTAPGQHRCPNGHDLPSLGLPPVPFTDVPMSSAVQRLAIPAVPQAGPADLHRHVCAWCLRRVVPQVADRCDCGAPFARLPPLALRGLGPRLSPAHRGAFLQQASHPMKAQVALLRLGRLTRSQAVACGADDQLAGRMRAPPRPW